jgi:hypothetical protein
MQGLGSGVALEGGSGRYKHITAAVRRRNAAVAAACALFVAGVYGYTYSKMATNELQSLAAELDEVRAAREARSGGGAAPAAPAAPAAAAEAASALGGSTRAAAASAAAAAMGAPKLK